MITENKHREKFNPFPGLRPFGIEESYLYFGREGQSDEVLEVLEQNRFVNILGSSGTGKSSLMFSGVIPTLHAGFISEAGNEWEILTARPGLSPIKNLADAFSKLRQKHLPIENDYQKLINANLLEAILRKSSKGIQDLYTLNAFLKGKNLLIYLDQFEEIFRFRRQGKIEHINESLAYVNLILTAVNQLDIPIYIALSMRSDFLGDCEQFPDLTNKINDSHYLIPQMTRDQKRLVITGPVAVGEGTITNRLTQRLLNDMGDRPDQLPVLQHALMRTWDYWTENGKNNGEAIDFIHYEAIGGVNEALSRHADEAYYELDEEQQLLCEKIFKIITEKTGTSEGIRRPTPLAEIAQITDENEETLIPIIDKFRIKGRALLIPREDIKLNGESVIDISHEALMRVWYRLRNWVEEEAASANLYLQLSESAANYQAGSGQLWTQPDLQAAIDWRNKNKPTLKWALQYDNNFEAVITFLERSEQSYQRELYVKEQLQKKRLRRSRLIAYVLGTAAVASIILLVFALNQRLVAERQSSILEERTKQLEISNAEARKSELLAKEASQESRQFALQANKERRKAERQTLRARQSQYATEEANRQMQLALETAEEERKNALQANETAQKSNRNAVEQRSIAESFRMQSVSSALSVKSLQKQEQLKARLAFLGYRFNKKGKGYEHDNDVYNALFYAIKGLEPDFYNAFKSNSTDVRSLAIASGKSLYTTSAAGRINEWQLDGNKSNRNLVIYDEPGVYITNIYVDDNNESLVALTDSDLIIKIDLSEKIRTVKEIRLPENVYPYDLTFLESSDDFVVSASDSILYKYDNSEMKRFIKINSRAYEIDKYQEKYIITGNTNGQIQAWNLKNGRFRQNINEIDNNFIHSLKCEENKIAVGDNSGKVTVYYLNEALESIDNVVLRGSDNEIMTAILFNKGTDQVIASSTKGTIRIWDLNNVEQFPIIINEPNSWVNDIALISEEYIVAGCKDAIFRLYPIDVEILASTLRPKIYEDISREEWDRYIGEGLEYDPIFENSVFVNNMQ